MLETDELHKLKQFFYSTVIEFQEDFGVAVYPQFQDFFCKGFESVSKQLFLNQWRQSLNEYYKDGWCLWHYALCNAHVNEDMVDLLNLWVQNDLLNFDRSAYVVIFIEKEYRKYLASLNGFDLLAMFEKKAHMQFDAASFLDKLGHAGVRGHSCSYQAIIKESALLTKTMEEIYQFRLRPDSMECIDYENLTAIESRHEQSFVQKRSLSMFAQMPFGSQAQIRKMD